jgi:hypothetical protein
MTVEVQADAGGGMGAEASLDRSQPLEGDPRSLPPPHEAMGILGLVVKLASLVALPRPEITQRGRTADRRSQIRYGSFSVIR